MKYVCTYIITYTELKQLWCRLVMCCAHFVLFLGHTGRGVATRSPDQRENSIGPQVVQAAPIQSENLKLLVYYYDYVTHIEARQMLSLIYKVPNKQKNITDQQNFFYYTAWGSPNYFVILNLRFYGQGGGDKVSFLELRLLCFTTNTRANFDDMCSLFSLETRPFLFVIYTRMFC